MSGWSNACYVAIFRTIWTSRRSLVAFPMMVVPIVVAMVRLVLRLWFGLMLSQVIPLIRLMMSYTITLIVVML